MISIGANNGYTAYGVQKYIVDYVSDIGSLPTHCGTGSTAFIIENSSTYMMNSQKQWILVRNTGSGSNSGGEDISNTIVRVFINEDNNHLMYETTEGRIYDVGEINSSDIETQIVTF